MIPTVPGGADGLKIGLFLPKSHEIISVLGCSAHHPAINQALEARPSSEGLIRRAFAIHCFELTKFQVSSWIPEGTTHSLSVTVTVFVSVSVSLFFVSLSLSLSVFFCLFLSFFLADQTASPVRMLLKLLPAQEMLHFFLILFPCCSFSTCSYFFSQLGLCNFRASVSSTWLITDTCRLAETSVQVPHGQMKMRRWFPWFPERP